MDGRRPCGRRLGGDGLVGRAHAVARAGPCAPAGARGCGPAASEPATLAWSGWLGRRVGGELRIADGVPGLVHGAILAGHTVADAAEWAMSAHLFPAGLGRVLGHQRGC